MSKINPDEPLTEKEWRYVFAVRCISKQGRPISEGERALIVRAYASDPRRYAAMDRDVFKATAPFGSKVP